MTITGDLEFATTGTLLRLITDRLTGDVREVRLDCARIGFCDSSGLSELMKVHRVVTGAGARLYLDHRQPAPDRLLARTGTAAHFTGEARDSRAAAGQRQGPWPTGRTRISLTSTVAGWPTA